MSHKVGIWIDHKRAVIVRLSADGVSTTAVDSGIGPHGRRGRGYPAPDAPRPGGAEKNHEERYRRHLERYYDEIIDGLGQPETLLILGPGRAKLQLRERLGRSAMLAERVVGVENMDAPTDSQIVARVTERLEVGSQ
jgi:hypothetical protein